MKPKDPRLTAVVMTSLVFGVAQDYQPLQPEEPCQTPREKLCAGVHVGGAFREIPHQPRFDVRGVTMVSTATSAAADQYYGLRSQQDVGLAHLQERLSVRSTRA
jgi:hypothetical protein